MRIERIVVSFARCVCQRDTEVMWAGRSPGGFEMSALWPRAGMRVVIEGDDAHAATCSRAPAGAAKRVGHAVYRKIAAGQSAVMPARRRAPIAGRHRGSRGRAKPPGGARHPGGDPRDAGSVPDLGRRPDQASPARRNCRHNRLFPRTDPHRRARDAGGGAVLHPRAHTDAGGTAGEPSGAALIARRCADATPVSCRPKRLPGCSAPPARCPTSRRPGTSRRASRRWWCAGTRKPASGIWICSPGTWCRTGPRICGRHGGRSTRERRQSRLRRCSAMPSRGGARWCLRRRSSSLRYGLHLTDRRPRDRRAAQLYAAANDHCQAQAHRPTPDGGKSGAENGYPERGPHHARNVDQ